MSHATITREGPAQGYATVHVEELDHWGRLLGRIEDWLLHADDDTIAHCWAQFAGPWGEDIDEITDTLGRATVRMRDLAQGRP